ncbi:WD40 repeat-like protein [Lentinula aciculospora]|uniref:WD40 repeat-like protein n=1 Tax=Lentinula aciculospora TaxID=153920 RepID=A0A9W9ALN9_9AGAR|nr:WD40 repeat-like protein [Lentinula aciculospora]
MAASTSREPQDVPLPPSPPYAHGKIGKFRKAFNEKGKGKETSGGQRKRSAAGKPSATSNIHPIYEDDPPLDWISLTDSPPSKTPPILTQDGSYYFALVGSSVQIFATYTGQLVSTLSAPASITGPSDMTSVVLNPQNIFQIITGSLDGIVRIWDYLDATLIRTLDIAQPIHHICTHGKHQEFIFVTVSRPSKPTKKPSEDASSVLRISLKAMDASAPPAAQRPLDIISLGKIRYPTGLAVSPSGNWLVATAGHKAYVANLLNIKSGFTKYVSPDRISCLTFHPVEDYFATGDVKGNIRLWYCLNEPTTFKVAGLEKKTQTASFHWHAHAVSSLAFTSNGSYLLSGGEESVLVIWQLHSGKKEFIPRLGAPIQTISVTKTLRGGEEYLLGLTDATFVFVSASALKISRSYSRVKLFPSDNTSSSLKSVPLAVHPSSSTFILPSSHASSIQMFSLTSSKIVSELEIFASNRVSRREELPIEPSRVEHTVVSASGDWMASIDARAPNEDFQGEVYMKIWHWEQKTSLWTLNTRIDRPHGLHKVLALSFSPRPQDGQESYLVTTGGDGAVKTWRLRSDREKNREGEGFWTARSSFTFPSEIPSHVSWSPDGSLLAVTSGAYVSLYDALTNIHRTTFTSPECSHACTAQFIGRGRFLAIQGKQELVVWDIVSRSVRWSYTSSYPIYNVVTHPENDSFVILTSAAPGRSRVHTFSPSLSKPSKTTYLPFTLLNAIWYSSKPTSSLSLAGITNDWRFVLVGDDVKAPEKEGTSATGIKSRSLPQRRTLFQDIFGKSIFDQPLADDSSAATLHRPAASVDKTVFDVPAHLAPPLESLFDSIMMGFLKQRPIEQDYPTEEASGDDDVSMEVDNPEPVVPSRSTKVDAKEITSLVAVFQMHSLQTHAPKTPKVNGVVKVNGIHSKPSSTPSRAPQSTKSKPSRQVDVVSPLFTEPSPSPTVNGIGKKRKKALDYF